MTELFFKVEDEGIKNLLLAMELKSSDPILYLGGRVDDNNLYPPGYTKYLNQKIKELNPKKIICHSHWYAWKYYKKGILDESMKIDLIVCNYKYLSRHTFDPINKADYNGSHLWCIKELIDKNIKTIFAAYETHTGKPVWKSVEFYINWFKGCHKKYDANNIKYFTLDRRYSPSSLTDKKLGHGNHTRNATDGFAILSSIIELGFKQVNILGFTAFGSDEDSSNFTNYVTSKDQSINNKNYFHIETSEDQRAEADILNDWIENERIYNLEDYQTLRKYLQKN